MPSLLPRRSQRLTLLLCLLGATSLPMTAGQARPWTSDSPYSVDRSDQDDRDRDSDRYRAWLELQRTRTEQAYQQTQRRLDQLERCLERSRQNRERDQCLRRDLEARQRDWQREQRNWQQLIRRSGGVAQLAWPFGT